MIGARGIRDIGEICRNPQESQFAFQMSGSLGSSSVIKQCIVGKRLPRFSSRDNSLQLSNYNMHYLMTEWAMNNQHRRPSSRNRIPNKQTEQPWFFSAGFSDLSPGEENTPTWGEENIQLLIVLPRCCGFVRVHSPHQSWMTTEITIHGQYRVCIPRHSIKKEVKTVTGHSLLLELLVDIPSLFSFFRLLLKERWSNHLTLWFAQTWHAGKSSNSMEVSIESWENHQTRTGIFQQATFDVTSRYIMVYPTVGYNIYYNLAPSEMFVRLVSPHEY